MSKLTSLVMLRWDCAKSSSCSEDSTACPARGSSSVLVPSSSVSGSLLQGVLPWMSSFPAVLVLVVTEQAVTASCAAAPDEVLRARRELVCFSLCVVLLGQNL